MPALVDYFPLGCSLLDIHVIIEHIYYSFHCLFVSIRFEKTNTNKQNPQRCWSCTQTTPHIGQLTLKSPVCYYSFFETNIPFSLCTLTNCPGNKKIPAIPGERFIFSTGRPLPLTSRVWQKDRDGSTPSLTAALGAVFWNFQTTRSGAHCAPFIILRWIAGNARN